MGTLFSNRDSTIPLVVIPGFLAILGFCFLPLYAALEDGAFVFASFLPLSAGIILGFRLGFVYWLLHSVLLSVFAQIVGQTSEDLLSKGLPSFAVTLILTLSVGKIKDLTKALKQELKERKRFEAELQQYKEKLEKLVEERTAELMKSNEQLKEEIIEREKANKEKTRLEISLKRAEKMEAVGILAGSVAHDLNNILSGIISYPELILLNIPEDSPLRKPVLMIKSSGEKAAAVVQDLLTLSRRGLVDSQVVNMNQVVTDFLQSPEYLKIHDEHPGITVETKLQPDLFGMHGSLVHLSKMVMNLITNSIEAMSQGGHLTVSTQNVYIDKPEGLFETLQEGEYISLLVADTGEGVAQDDLDKIFEPFYSNKFMGRSGTGLGLAIVWGTVKDHKGYVDVQSEVDKGTCFTLYFPATRENIAIQKVSLKLEDYGGKGETILVIDDVEMQRDICTSILEKLGYQVSAVSSGEEAIEYLQQQAVDLLILDMIMSGGIDGLETYEKIISLQSGQKAVIVSGFAESERVKKTLSLGAGVYVRKPYTMEKLGLAVREVLGGYN